ncbi:HEAT-like protein repeat-containing protein [Geoanaerobacter pelophilus]|uniref:HEAT-like protein repeat-containing protein n=2 Tax=Geoanaerobacter pelophilus TaxID=60036 RepID=A0ABQ0MLW5_9BACT|nr:HEAT-like protein repeat-containing protein [Geoanaerobacter pelophilus]
MPQKNRYDRNIEERMVNLGGRHEGVTREEYASANLVMIAMVKASKALRIYLPNNPILIGFMDDLDGRMTGHLESYGEFVLDVEPFILRYKGKDIYQNQDPKESMACRIYADGIRTLFFLPGIESRELMAFLGVVGFELSTSDEDVVTQLWERDLPHLRYLLEEDFVEGHLEEDLTEPGSQQAAVTRVYQALAQQIPSQPRMIPKHLLMLTGEEEKWLRKARQVEARRNGLDDVINILSAILAGVKEPEIFWDFVGIMGNLASNMFLAGEIGHALRLIRFMDQLMKLGSTKPEQRKLLSDALARILDLQTVQVLQETLDGSDAVTHQDLKELLLIFGLPSLGAICELLGRVEKLKVRKVIIEVLVELGRKDPGVFTPFLDDPRWYLVRNVVLVLSLVGTPVALEMIIRLISHKEARIRREVLGYLERSGDLKAKTYIVKYLRDDSSALRIKALQILAREKLPFALKPVLALTTADEFATRSLAEKKAVYEALGELGGDEILPMFRDMLLRKYWFQKAAEKESAQLAVAGLLRMQSGQAKKLLQEARNNRRSGEIRDILDQALAAFDAVRGKRGAGAVEV